MAGEKGSEGMCFVRYDMRDGAVVAIFSLDQPVIEWGPEGDSWVVETLFNRASLESRLKNLRASGQPSKVTADVLAHWPGSGQADVAPRGQDREIAWDAKADAVLRLLRGETPGMVASAAGVPESTLADWQAQFLEAGKASLSRLAPS